MSYLAIGPRGAHGYAATGPGGNSAQGVVVAVTLDGVSASSAVVGDLVAAASITLGGVSAAGQVEASLTASASMQLAGVSASGTIASEPASVASAAITLGGVTTIGAIESSIESTAAIVLDGVVSLAIAGFDSVASSTIALDGVTTDASLSIGAVTLASLASTLHGVTVSATITAETQFTVDLGLFPDDLFPCELFELDHQLELV